MKKERAIIIKDLRLRKARNELRTLLNLWFNDQWASIREAGPKFSKNVQDKCSDLEIMFENSICYCGSCGTSTLDMAYVPTIPSTNEWDVPNPYAIYTHEWVCVECNSKRIYISELRKKLLSEMTLMDIEEFLDKLSSGVGLSRSGWKCHGYEESERILFEMEISKETQDKFLELCGYYDGYCDCEILLNASRHLLK